jgi:hypothetical protein
MRHASSKTLGAVVAALLASPALAAPPSDYEPGINWETTIEMDMAGMKMPPQTSKFCKPKKEWSEPPGTSHEGDCKTTEMKRSGNRMTWKVVCTGKNPMTGEGDMTYTANTYAGTMAMHMKDGDMNMKMKGREIGGDCDANEMKRKVAGMQAAAKEQQAQGEQMQAQQMAKACDDGVKKMQAMAFTGMVAFCKDPAKKQEFCSRMSTREGFAALRANNPEPQRNESAQACGKDLAAIQGSLCKDAKKDAMSNQGSMGFLVQDCPAEAQALAQSECAGIDYTSASRQQRQLCTTYAKGSLEGKKKAAPASDTPKTTDDALKKAAKGLLPF